ncbi:MAG: hypothetical protein WDZ35_06370 [Crocinitomicaceae bacterium]
MKYFFYILTANILLYSCGNSSSEESIAEEDKINETDKSTDKVWPQTEEGYVDTLVPFERQIKFESKIKTPQIKEDIYYQYYYNGFEVYDSVNMRNQITQLHVGDTVKYLGGYSDVCSFKRFKGYRWEVLLMDDSTKGATGSNFLLPLPYPGEELKDRSLLGYLKYYLLETGPSVERGAFHGEKEIGLEDEWQEIERNFEGGIVYKKTKHYESGAHIVYIPKMSIENGLFFLDALFTDHNFLEITEGFPTKERYEFEDEEWGASYIEVDCDYGAILMLNKIKIRMGEGCGEWYKVRPAEGGIEIESGSGC